MRLLKTHSHTSERPGYEDRKNAKKVIEGNADTIRRQTIRQNLPRTASVAGGRDEKGAMARPTPVKTRPRIVGAAGGLDEERRIWSRTQARRQGKSKAKPSRRLPSWRGGRDKRRKPTRNGKVAQPTVPRGVGVPSRKRLSKEKTKQRASQRKEDKAYSPVPLCE